MMKIGVSVLVWALALTSSGAISKPGVQEEEETKKRKVWTHAWPKEKDSSLPEAKMPEKKINGKLRLNEAAPDLVVEEWLSAKPEMKGKMVMVDFWATWCPPCREAIPNINELHKKFKDRLVVIGLSDENAATVKKMEKPVLEYHSAVDKEGEFKKFFEVKGIPHVVLMDPTGVVRWQGNPLSPADPLNEERVLGLLDTYVKKPEEKKKK